MKFDPMRCGVVRAGVSVDVDDDDDGAVAWVEVESEAWKQSCEKCWSPDSEGSEKHFTRSKRIVDWIASH